MKTAKIAERLKTIYALEEQFDITASYLRQCTDETFDKAISELYRLRRAIAFQRAEVGKGE
jgi:acyl-coenzyme A thioesterase PaaI-like protein